MEQVPYAIDILAVRHPIAVGLVRSLLNDQGAIDRVAENYVRSSMQQQDPSTFACYAAYYVVMFDKDDLRNAMADQMEKDLNLNNLGNLFNGSSNASSSPSSDTGSGGNGDGNNSGGGDSGNASGGSGGDGNSGNSGSGGSN